MDKLQKMSQIETLASEDEYYQSLLVELTMMEPEFDRIVQQLPIEQKQLIDRYLILCEEADHRKLQLTVEHFLNIKLEE